MGDVQSAPRPIPPNTGGELAPENIIGRDDFILNLLNEMRRGADVLLVDPRRMGKTMTLRRLCNERVPDLHAMLIDLEGATSTRECFGRIAKGLSHDAPLWKKLQKTIGKFVEAGSLEVGVVKINAVVADLAPLDLLVDVLEAVDRQLVKDARQLILALDEVPIAVELIRENEGAPAAAAFLHKLRHLQSSTRSIRWVLAGSIGFHHVLGSVGVTEGVLADFAHHSPGPLADADAMFLAQCLLLGIEREPEEAVATELARVSGRIPFIMHHVAHRLSLTEPPTGSVEVEAAFESFAGDRDASRALTHLLTRLDDNRLVALLDTLAVEGPMSFDELQEHLASSGTTYSRDELLRMLDLLRDDHYLTRDAARYEWRYDVLRRVWMFRRDLSR